MSDKHLIVRKEIQMLENIKLTPKCPILGLTLSTKTDMEVNKIQEFQDRYTLQSYCAWYIIVDNLCKTQLSDLVCRWFSGACLNFKTYKCYSKKKREWKSIKHDSCQPQIVKSENSSSKSNYLQVSTKNIDRRPVTLNCQEAD